MDREWQYPEGRLLLFAKAPVPGGVKTRLAGHLGASGAAWLYRQMAERMLALAVSAELAPVRLCCAPDCRHPFFSRLRREYAAPSWPQAPGDLGRRMRLAAQRALSDADAAVIIGADCLGLTAQHISEAFAALRNGSDLVLGPAEDGGYVLIGMRRPVPPLFAGMNWGSSRVLRDTLVRARRLHLRVHQLAAAWDIDRPADLARARRSGLLRAT